MTRQGQVAQTAPHGAQRRACRPRCARVPVCWCLGVSVSRFPTAVPESLSSRQCPGVPVIPRCPFQPSGVPVTPPAMFQRPCHPPAVPLSPRSRTVSRAGCAPWRRRAAPAASGIKGGGGRAAVAAAAAAATAKAAAAGDGRPAAGPAPPPGRAHRLPVSRRLATLRRGRSVPGRGGPAVTLHTPG